MSVQRFTLRSLAAFSDNDTVTQWALTKAEMEEAQIQRRADLRIKLAEEAAAERVRKGTIRRPKFNRSAYMRQRWATARAASPASTRELSPIPINPDAVAVVPVIVEELSPIVAATLAAIKWTQCILDGKKMMMI